MAEHHKRNAPNDIFSRSVCSLQSMHTSAEIALDAESVQRRENERLSYILKNIVHEVADLAATTDLHNAQAPFLPNTFTLWRKHAYEKLTRSTSFSLVKNKSDWRRRFCAEVDEKVFANFCAQLLALYEAGVYDEQHQIPSGGISVREMRDRYHFSEEVHALTRAIAEWCVQVEVTQDLVARIKLYGQEPALKPLEAVGGVVNELKIKLAAEHDTVMMHDQNWNHLILNDGRSAIAKAVEFGLSKAKKMCDSKDFSLWSTGAAVAYSLVTTATVPWSLAVMGIGSKFIGQGIDHLLVAVQTPQKRKQISAVTEMYLKLTESIGQRVQECERLLSACVSGEDRQKDLQKAIERIVCDYGEQASAENQAHASNDEARDSEQQTHAKEGVLVVKGTLIKHKEQADSEWVEIDFAQSGDSEDQQCFEIMQ